MGVQINGDTGNISATKADYSGNVTIGGTLTYEDVTNIDSVGLVTARSGIEVGARPGVAASISVDGNMIVSGISTFGGDVQVPDKIIHAGDTNTAIRFPDADTVSVETSGSEALRVDSSGRLLIKESSVAGSAQLCVGNGGQELFEFTSGSSTYNGGLIEYIHRGDGTTRPDLNMYLGGPAAFKVYTNATERLRIASDGSIGIAGANYGSTGQVLTSQGSGSAVQWATPALLQMKYEGNNTTISRNAAGMADIGFGSVQITPKLSSSIMIVSFTGRGYADGNNQSYFSFFFSEDGGSYSQVPGLDSTNGMSRIINGDDFTLSMRYAHDHNTTSVLQYKIYASVGGGTTYLNWDSTYGLLTVEEIAS